jgi:stage V sporulation protein D (sporulation-specific penicillin-binding protein)
MKRKRIDQNSNNFRISIINVVFLLGTFVLVARLFQIQIIKHKYYEALAQEQYWDVQEIPAKRGDILSSDGYPLATTQVSYLVYAEPKMVEDKYKAIRSLTQIMGRINKYELESPYEFYENKFEQSLNTDLYWVKLHGELTPDEKNEIESLGLKGIGFEEEPKRYYPEKTLSSHVLGFVAHDENGNPRGYFGIEGRFDGDLRGRPGRIIEERDAFGAPILVGGYKKVDPIEGRNIILTINRAVQYLVEGHLKRGVEEYGAVSGSVIVMDPSTGDVIAMANYPTYDPANFNDFGAAIEDGAEIRRVSVERRNLSISQTYEPGSVMKGLTVATAVDLGKVNPETTFVDSGPVQYSDYVIDNWDRKHHGVQTIVQLLQKSNNIGAAWVGHQVGSENLSEYLKKFGLGSTLGIDLEGEDTGIIRDHQIWTDIDLANISFGQGISVTPLQMLNSFNALANNGNLMRPRIVKEIVDMEENIVMPVKVQEKVVSSETADTMVYLLTQAVEGGESRYYNINSYKIAGKTGTAQIPVGGKYDPRKTNATFLGFLSESKKFSMIVRLEEPTSSVYASETAVPLWMDITRDLVKYYGVPPDYPNVAGETSFIESNNDGEEEEAAIDEVEETNTPYIELEEDGGEADTTTDINL